MFGPEEAVTGYFNGISNADYHGGEGVSKTTLDHIEQSPAQVPWSKAAPEDKDKQDALNMGDAMHALLLEPVRFTEEYLVVTQPVERRSNSGKAHWAAIEAEAKAENKSIILPDDHKKLILMRDSVMAHPEARALMELEGDAEPSLYWTDEETGLLCRCRPDKAITKINSMVDVKTTADMAKFWRSVVDYRYYVQDPFYSEGWRNVLGTAPERFLFLVVSTSINCGRYPVRVIELSPGYKDIGARAYRRNLRTYAECQANNSWPGIETLNAPEWLK